MFIWTFLFPCLAKRKLKQVDTGYDDVRICSVPHIGMKIWNIITRFNVCLCHLTTMNQIENSGYYTWIAIILIIICIIIVIIVYFDFRKSLNKYKNNFIQSPVYNKLNDLITKCRQTGGDKDFLGSGILNHQQSQIGNNYYKMHLLYPMQKQWFSD